VTAVPKAIAARWNPSPNAQMLVRVSRLMRHVYRHVGKGWKFLTAGIDLRHFPPSCCG
jgi:hypothetical protein